MGILRAVDIIRHDQATRFGNQDPLIVLVVDEMLLVGEVLGNSALTNMITQLGGLLEPNTSQKILFVTSALSSRISYNMRTPGSHRELFPIPLSGIATAIARDIVANREDGYSHNSSGHMSKPVVECAITECFGVPRLLACLSDVLLKFKYSASVSLQALRTAVILAYQRDFPAKDIRLAFATCLCIPVHYPKLKSEILMRSTDDKEGSAPTLRQKTLFFLHEIGLIYNFSSSPDYRSYGIPPIFLSCSTLRPDSKVKRDDLSTLQPHPQIENDFLDSEILALAANFGSVDDAAKMYAPHLLEQQLATALILLHWRDRLCAGVLASIQEDDRLRCWISSSRTKTRTSVAELLNLRETSLNLPSDHTARSPLRLCDLRVETDTVVGKSLTTVHRPDRNQFLLLRPRIENFPGCDIIVAAPMENSEKDFFFVVECKMTRDPANQTKLSTDTVEKKFKTCLQWHPVLLEAFLDSRLCYLAGGMRCVSSLDYPKLAESLTKRAPEKAGEKKKKVIVNPLADRLSHLKPEELNGLCVRSVFVVGREDWAKILTPTLACRPQWDPSFSE